MIQQWIGDREDELLPVLYIDMFEFNYVIRGHHVYRNVWNPTIGEELLCRRELVNHHDRFAVAIVKDSDTVVGHAPKKVFSLFLRRGGTITCRVTGSRCYSEDLPQGGLEVPCVYVFDGMSQKHLLRAEELIKQAMASIPDPPTLPARRDDPPSKKKKTDNVTIEPASPDTNDLITSVLKGEKLSDQHMTLAQDIFKKQFPDFGGLQMTFLQTKGFVSTSSINCLQIIHCQVRNHWILASTVGCNNRKVNIYDSAFTHLDEETEQVVCKLFQIEPVDIEMKTAFQKQIGGTECGLFAIAALTAVAFKQDPCQAKFCQVKMRDHLATCLKNEKFTLFP